MGGGCQVSGVRCQVSGCECHGHVPWVVTRFATEGRASGIANATGMSRGSLRYTLQEAAPWGTRMPRARPVDRYAACYGRPRPGHLRDRSVAPLACHVRLHGTCPWHLRDRSVAPVVCHVRLHGTCPWHLAERVRGFRSVPRETPRDVPVASIYDPFRGSHFALLSCSPFQSDGTVVGHTRGRTGHSRQGGLPPYPLSSMSRTARRKSATRKHVTVQSPISRLR